MAMFNNMPNPMFPQNQFTPMNNQGNTMPPGMGNMMPPGMGNMMPPGMPNGMPNGMPGMMMPQGAMPPQVPSGATITPTGSIVPISQEESFVENILRMNLGKVATLYMTYENNSEWNAKIFKGVLEAAGRDHIIISDPSTGMRFLLLTLNLDYITFDEPINYTLPFGTSTTSRY